MVHPVLIILINKTVVSNIHVSWLQYVKLWVWLLEVLHSLEHICSTTFLIVFWLHVGPLSIQKWSASFSIKWNAYMKASFSRILTAVDMSPEIWPMLYVEVPNCLSTKTYWMQFWTSMSLQNISSTDCRILTKKKKKRYICCYVVV